MIDRKKVIKAFDDAKELVWLEDNEYTVGYNNGIEAGKDIVLSMLREREAVEARKKSDGKPQPWTSWWYVCGDCGQEIEYHDRFCRWCGRSVKWNE